MEWTALAGLGAAAALCALVVKQRSPELAVLVSLAACAVLLTRTLPLFETVRDRMEALVGLAVVTKLAASLCRDAGEGSVAAFVELAGSAAAVVVALPLLDMVLKLVEDLL